jgi:hypothetical protein
MAGTTFDINRFGVSCPECGKTNKYLVSELVANEKITCSYCGGVIDLKEHRAAIIKIAEELKQVKFIDHSNSRSSRKSAKV